MPSFHNTVIAHRGASAYAPENTIPAFLKAIELGASWIEFDVNFTKCGTPVVFHDYTLQRLLGVNGKIYDYTFTYLRNLAIKANGDVATTYMPSLYEVLNYLSAYDVSLNIEIKSRKSFIDLFISNLISDIAKSKFVTNRLLISSFSLPMLRQVRQNADSLALAFISPGLQKNKIKMLRQINATGYVVSMRSLNADIVNYIHEQGLKVLAYTVNHKQKASELFAIGVDAIFSDYPDLLLIENKENGDKNERD